jgi:FdhD protein
MSSTLAGDLGPGIWWPIERIGEQNRDRLDDPVVLEEPLEITVNQHSLAVLMRMPGHEKELAAGFCVSEGYVRQAADILVIRHCGRDSPAAENKGQDPAESRNRVEVHATQEGFRLPDRPDVVRLIRSGCGAADASVLAEALPLLHGAQRVPAAVVLGLGQALRDLQSVHNTVGGTHSAALFDLHGTAIVGAEDIGRHNAVDKAIGHCLLWGIPLDDKILVTSGRASYEMAAKAIRVGIPILATISAPTSLAVQIAHDRGLTLIGYLRSKRMNVYTHPERLT